MPVLPKKVLNLSKPSRCSICGEPQIRTTSGLVCCNGHGGADSLVPFPPVCVACSDTGRASNGQKCVPCLVSGRIKG